MNDTFYIYQIPAQLHDPFISAIDKGNIRTIANRSMPAAPHPTPGALLMGDAFNMRHPLTGGGMTVALSDVVLLHNLLKPLRDLHDASSLCKYLESFYTLRKVNRVFLLSSSWFLSCISDIYRLFQSLLDFLSQCIYGLFFSSLMKSRDTYAASCFYNKHLSRCSLQGLLCIT